MEVILLMTGKAILRCSLHIRNGAVIDVTACTFDLGMLTNQVERHSVMVEVCAMRIDTIMTGHAVCPERENMFRSKYLIIV